MERNKRTVKEDILLIKRGIQEFGRILPGQMGFLVFRSVIGAMTPYIAVLMSALILNELVGMQNRTRLVLYVLASAGAAFLLSWIGCRLDARIAVGYSRLFSTHEIILTDKAYRIPFFLLEKEDTRSLREQVSGSISLTGGGMASLYWDMEVVVKNLCSAVIAIGLGLGVAKQIAAGVRGGKVSGSTAVLVMLSLALLIAGGAWITCKTASKRFQVSFDVFEHGAKYNRYGEFYDLSYLPDENMAMDIRIFRQKELVLWESQQKCYRLLARGKEKEMQAVSRLDVVRILCTGLCGMAVYAMVGFLAVREVIGIGNVLMISSAVTMLIAALSDLAQIITDLRNNNVHLLNYFRYMDLEEEAQGQSGAGKSEKAQENERQEQMEIENAENESGNESGNGNVYSCSKIFANINGITSERSGNERHKRYTTGAVSLLPRINVLTSIREGRKRRSDEEKRENIKGIKKDMQWGGKETLEFTLEGVSFSYPESKETVLWDINLRIAPGEKLAIVGENGSGKTTLIKLLCRLYRPTEGRILLNGEDIQNYPYEEYIRKIATVFQDFSLFAFPIAENVAASREYDGQKVYEALCRAGLQKKIDSLSKGIKQAVSHDYSEDGMDLSGGEAQKAAIARAIYKAAPVVILDEPTAALDPYAEKEIYEQFFNNLSGETMLSISHRLSSCRFCDRIIVLHGGRLVQQGTHEELLEQTGGKYAQLWEAQSQYYCESPAASLAETSQSE